ncbi:hypothetical protein BJ508DRAFT_330516 [Ascobolus immersus RN42]|uniref:Uncharacterized protein n=1 Tax=Ascobolus immersus RN42 TaxID=1160509 RepID=A0A3N4HTA8_ASCIM|nr:hypothetical protein BJ508DRAFT_330516 [Ascobolus immersus RN42]
MVLRREGLRQPQDHPPSKSSRPGPTDTPNGNAADNSLGRQGAQDPTNTGTRQQAVSKPATVSGKPNDMSASATSRRTATSRTSAPGQSTATPASNATTVSAQRTLRTQTAGSDDEDDASHRAKKKPKSRKTAEILGLKDSSETTTIIGEIKDFYLTFTPKYYLDVSFKSEYSKEEQDGMILELRDWVKERTGKRPSKKEARVILTQICQDNVRNHNKAEFRRQVAEALEKGLPPPEKRKPGRPRKTPLPPDKAGGGANTASGKASSTTGSTSGKSQAEPRPEGGGNNTECSDLLVHLPDDPDVPIKCPRSICSKIGAWHQWLRTKSDLWQDLMGEGYVMFYCPSTAYDSENSVGLPIMTSEDITGLSKFEAIHVMVVHPDDVAAYEEEKRQRLEQSRQLLQNQQEPRQPLSEPTAPKPLGPIDKPHQAPNASLSEQSELQHELDHTLNTTSDTINNAKDILDQCDKSLHQLALEKEHLELIRRRDEAVRAEIAAEKQKLAREREEMEARLQEKDKREAEWRKVQIAAEKERLAQEREDMEARQRETDEREAELRLAQIAAEKEKLAREKEEMEARLREKDEREAELREAQMEQERVLRLEKERVENLMKELAEIRQGKAATASSSTLGPRPQGATPTPRLSRSIAHEDRLDSQTDRMLDDIYKNLHFSVARAKHSLGAGSSHRRPLVCDDLEPPSNQQRNPRPRLPTPPPLRPPMAHSTAVPSARPHASHPDERGRAGLGQKLRSSPGPTASKRKTPAYPRSSPDPKRRRNMPPVPPPRPLPLYNIPKQPALQQPIAQPAAQPIAQPAAAARPIAQPILQQPIAEPAAEPSAPPVTQPVKKRGRPRKDQDPQTQGTTGVPIPPAQPPVRRESIRQQEKREKAEAMKATQPTQPPPPPTPSQKRTTKRTAALNFDALAMAEGVFGQHWTPSPPPEPLDSIEVQSPLSTVASRMAPKVTKFKVSGRGNKSTSNGPVSRGGGASATRGGGGPVSRGGGASATRGGGGPVSRGGGASAARGGGGPVSRGGGASAARGVGGPAARGRGGARTQRGGGKR